MGNNKATVPLVLGCAVTAAAAAVLYCAPAFGARHALTGTVAGIGIACIGLLLHLLLLPRAGGGGTSLLKSYFPGAAVRYVVLTGTFCAVIFWLKIEAISVLVGAFAGMTASTFVTLIFMKRATAVPPDEQDPVRRDHGV